MNERITTLVRGLAKTSQSAGEIKLALTKYLSEEELKDLWSIPRKNIINFVTNCFESGKLKPPFVEVGCGRRNYKPEAAKKFGSNVPYIAFDHYMPRDNIVDILRLPNVLASVTNLPIISQHANTVICTEVLEHVEDDNAVLAEISRITKSNGKLVLTLPGIDIPNHEKLPYQIDYRRYKFETVEVLLQLHGFNGLKFERRTQSGLEINLFVLAQKS